MEKTTRRNSKQQEQLLVHIAERYCKNMTQVAIAEEFDLSQGYVSKLLAKVRAAWRKSYTGDYMELLYRELAKCDHLEALAYVGYEQSQGKSTELKKQLDPVKNTVLEKELKEKKPAAGDPAFLAVIDRCIQRRSQLLGLIDTPLVQQYIESAQSKAAEGLNVPPRASSYEEWLKQNEITPVDADFSAIEASDGSE